MLKFYIAIVVMLVAVIDVEFVSGEVVVLVVLELEVRVVPKRSCQKEKMIMVKLAWLTQSS